MELSKEQNQKIADLSGAKQKHDNRFAGYRRPTEVTIPKFEAIQTKTKELADLIYNECPESLEKSKALTDLQNVRMWANAAVAIHTN